ncbi:MAG: TolC family protein, partial [Roseibacillus sp.]
MPRPALLLPFAIATLLPGCALQKKWFRPQEQARIDVPSLWNEAAQGQNRKIATGWLSEFGDARMTSLVREAIRRNNNLQAAAYRLKSTRESTIVGRSARLPSVNASGASSRSYSGLGPAPGVSSDSYGLSFSASWEIDVWGRLRDLDYATRADYEAALADFRGAQLSLAVNTAQSWANLTESQQQLELAEKTLADFEKSLSLISRRQKEAL